MTTSHAAAYRIVEFGHSKDAVAPATDLAGLHSELLSHSPLVLMGPSFVERFYYTRLPEMGLISGAVAYVNGRAAGFIVATPEPNDFMDRAMKRHWLGVGWNLATSVIKNPTRLRALAEAYRIQKNVDAQDYGPEMGEMLSFGVLETYRSRSFVRDTGISIGVDLLERATAQLRRAGKQRVRAIVDKDNLEAQLFYRFQGWRVGLADVQGWAVPTMEFLVDLTPETESTKA